jgi:hypothetical protein
VDSLRHCPPHIVMPIGVGSVRYRQFVEYWIDSYEIWVARRARSLSVANAFLDGLVPTRSGTRDEYEYPEFIADHILTT